MTTRRTLVLLGSWTRGTKPPPDAIPADLALLDRKPPTPEPPRLVHHPNGYTALAHGWNQLAGLLRHAILLLSLPELLHELRHSPILAVSDGGAKHGKGSLGWIVATDKGLRHAECWGPAYGIKIKCTHSGQKPMADT